jgi:hypothetical protein
MGFEIGFVRVEAGEIQLVDATSDPLADLLLDPAKSGPAHAQPGKHPLQKVDANVPVHVVVSS